MQIKDVDYTKEQVQFPSLESPYPKEPNQRLGMSMVDIFLVPVPADPHFFLYPKLNIYTRPSLVISK